MIISFFFRNLAKLEAIKICSLAVPIAYGKGDKKKYLNFLHLLSKFKIR